MLTGKKRIITGIAVSVGVAALATVGLFVRPWLQAPPGAEAAGGLTVPYALGSTPLSLADGGSAVVELVMTEGRRWSSDDPDFAYGGYLNGDVNYVGDFKLMVTSGGKTLSSLPVTLPNVEALCFYGPVTLQIADYNGDGDPDFTLGSWLWSGGNAFNLYSVNSLGGLSLLGTIERHDEIAASVLLEQPQPNCVAAKLWNQTTGETEAQLYRWNGKEFVKAGNETAHTE